MKITTEKRIQNPKITIEEKTKSILDNWFPSYMVYDSRIMYLLNALPENERKVLIKLKEQLNQPKTEQ